MVSARSEAVEVGRGAVAVAQGSASLLLFGPRSEDYDPLPGDVWAAAVWRTAGLPVGCPDGWMQVAERLRMPWPSGRPGLATATAWYRVAFGNEGTPMRVSFPLGVAGSAEGFVVMYRVSPFVCPRCGEVAKRSQDSAHGYCRWCRDWTGAAAERPDQLGRRPLAAVFEEVAR